LALVSPAFTIQNHWQGSSCKLKSKKTPPMIEKSSHRNIAEDCCSNSRTCVMMYRGASIRALSSASLIPANAANA